MVIYDHILILRKHTVKYLGVNVHGWYKLSSNRSEKENVTEKEREIAHVCQ